MAYALGARSRARLHDVHSDLVAVVERAITITAVDFTVLEGVRSLARQQLLHRQGASQLDGLRQISRHQTGHAVDLAPWLGGTVSWHWPHFFPIADAMAQAGRELGVPLRWGGNWQRSLTEWEGTAAELHVAYRGSFPDGPHFELPANEYPAAA